MTPTNDNRTPAEHRRLVAEQSTQGERAYQGGSWPQGNRLHKTGKVRLLGGLAGWQLLNQMPRLAAANDNKAVKTSCTEITERDVVDADTIVEADKKEPGKHYREASQEVFVVTARNDEGEPVKGEWRPIAGATSFARKHSGASPEWMADDVPEEDKRNAAIDCQRIRQKLGQAVCDLLDMAAGGATTTEISQAIGVSRTKAEQYVDAVIEKYLQIAA